MNYGGNVPDWHQYNASQTNEVTSNAQNVNSGHLAFIPGVNPSSLNAINLSSEGLEKHQNDTNFNPRHFQTHNNVSSGPNISATAPLSSMVQMQNCIGHYGSQTTRNPMLDNLNAPVDPRNTSMGSMNNDLGYRSTQVPFNGPMAHMGGPNCNVNAPSGPGPGPRPGPGPSSVSVPRSGSGPILGSGPGSRHGHVPTSGPGTMGPRNASVSSVPPGRAGPSTFISCKGPCCIPDPNINYQQWEKFGSYQANMPYRDNLHSSGYQTENRHFGNNCNFRKDNYDGKETMNSMLPNVSNVDHRRNFADYKYHKDHLVSRNYAVPPGMLHNYPVQNYNYTGEYQKYSYPVKEHPKPNGMNVSNPGVLKHQEQNFMAQQKYNNKQYQYENGNLVSKGVPTMNVNPSMVSTPQTSYFNSQYTRNIPTEVPHEFQETTDNNAVVNRMQPTFMHSAHSPYQVYQQKITMQKFSMENNLRELSRIPGYQSHPKYKECIMRYKEILKLQQSTAYQNPVQQTSRIPTPTTSTAVSAPINLQFDQNGMLINPNYLPDAFPKLQHAQNPTERRTENLEKQNKDQSVVMPDVKHPEVQQPKQLAIQSRNENVPVSCAESFQKQTQFSIQKDFNENQLKVQTSENHHFDRVNPNISNPMIMQEKASKEFANKPDLDVRQFLANWDETDDEEGTVSNLPDAILSDTTPVVVVSYENVNISAKASQSPEISKQSNFCANETAFVNEKSDETDVIEAQDCLTISYPSSENTEIVKTTKQTIQEGIVKPGSIIHCISNGPDEIPTIHIVDNLEISNILGATNDQVIETIENQKAISFFQEQTNAKAEALQSTAQQGKNKVSRLPVEYNASLDNVSKGTRVEAPDVPENVEATTLSINNQDMQVLSILPKSSSTENLNLKKQSSFMSEESHNPDDISLPDLPTSECTPISTTLNTPIQSDSEESSENIEDLTISTNPIEIMQNSPVISFTQSPVKMEPYGELNNQTNGKNRSLGTLSLEFEEENGYKNNGRSNEEDAALDDDFRFSTNNSRTKSGESGKNKSIKSHRNDSTQKKLFDSKEDNSSDPNTRSALTSIEYELEIAPSKEQEGKGDDANSASKSRNSESIESSTVHVATDLPESGSWEDEFVEEQLEKNLDEDRLRKSRKRSVEQLENSDNEKFAKDDSNSSQIGEHFACHMVSHNKSRLTAVIKNKEMQGTTEKNNGRQTRDLCGERSSEFRLATDNTKDISRRTEGKKDISKKLVTLVQENLRSQGSKKPEPHQKHSRSGDDGTKYTKEVMRMLKDFRRKKSKSCYSHDSKTENQDKKSKHYKEKKKNLYNAIHEKITSQELRDESFHRKNNRTDCSQFRHDSESFAAHKVRLEKSVSMINQRSDIIETSDLEKRPIFTKSFVKNANADFGIQVGNVNLKFKDSEIRKELNLGDKTQDRIKDSLDGIKIEINVSCTERNSRIQEYNNRLLRETYRKMDDRNSYESISNIAETCSSSVLDCQYQLCTKDHETMKSFEKTCKLPEQPTATETTNELNNKETDALLSAETEFANAGKKTNEEDSTKPNGDTNASIASKETCNSASRRTSKDVSKDLKSHMASTQSNLEVTQEINYPSKNTAKQDANNKASDKITSIGQDETQKNISYNSEDTPTSSEQLQEDLANSVDISSHLQSVSELFNMEKIDGKEAIAVSNLLKSIKKSTDDDLLKLHAKSLNPLSNLDFNYEKLDYIKCSGISCDRVPADEVVEFEENCTASWKKPKMDHTFDNRNMFESTSGYINPIFSSIDKLDDLHTVPVYTTKDGKISYSPNRRFLYHETTMEAQKHEGCSAPRKSYYANALSSFYNSKPRRLYKRNRHHTTNEKKKPTELKETKHFYERRRNYLDDSCSRSRSKYKDYLQPIKHRNNYFERSNTEVDRIYSDSEPDEEIMDRNKNRIADTSSHEKEHDNGNNKLTITKSCESESTAGCLYSRTKNEKAVEPADQEFSRNKDSSFQEVKSTEACSSQRNDKDNTKNPYLDILLHLEKQIGRPENSSFSEIEKSSTNENLETRANFVDCEEKSSILHAPRDCNFTENDPSSYEAAGSTSNPKEAGNGDKCEEIINMECSSYSKLLAEETSQNVEPVEKVIRDSDSVENVKKVDASVPMDVEPADLSLKKVTETIAMSMLQQDNSTENTEYETCRNNSSNLDRNDESETNKSHCSSISKTPNREENIHNISEEFSEPTVETPSPKNIPVEGKEVSLEVDVVEVSQEESTETESKNLEINSNELQESFKFCQKEKDEEEEDINSELSTENSTEKKTEENHQKSNDTINQEDSTINIKAASAEENESLYQISNETIEDEKFISKNERNEIETDDEKCTKVLEPLEAFVDTINEEKIETIKQSEVSDKEKITETDGIPSLEPMKATTDHLEQGNLLDKHSSAAFLEEIPSISDSKVNITHESCEEREMPVLNMYCSVTNTLNDDTADRKEAMEKNEKTRHQDTKLVPKLVIKKTESLNTKSECSFDYAEAGNSAERYDAKLISSMRMKIPKMLITKSRSRSTTPSVEIAEKFNSEKGRGSPSIEEADTRVDSDSKVFKFNNYESKIPKVKIKLEDVSPKNLKLCLKRKDIKKSVPKMKIKRVKTQSFQENEVPSATTKLKALDENTSEFDDESTDTDDEDKSLYAKNEKIPKLKLRRQEEKSTSSASTTKGHAKVALKRRKKTDEEDSKESRKHENNTKTGSTETKKNPLEYISEKIPKVIIKRSQVGAEFKCEISKSKKSSEIKTAMWQPKVQLQRMEVLDHMVKDLKQSNIALKHVSLKDTVFATDNSRKESNLKLPRSNSASNLLPVKCKQRRLSDYDYVKTMDAEKSVNNRQAVDLLSVRLDGIQKSKNEERKTLENVKETSKEIACISTSTHKSSDSSKGSKDTGRKSTTNSPVRKKSKKKSSYRMIRDLNDSSSDNESRDMERDAKDALSSSLSGEGNGSLTIQKGCLYSDNESESTTEDKSRKSTVVEHPQNFSNNDNFVIEVDSSDESETTIAILSASPDDSESEMEDHEFEDSKSKQLHVEDAMPTQLALELELMDNKTKSSNVFSSKTNQLSSEDSHYVHIERYEHISHFGSPHTGTEPAKLYLSESQQSFQETFKQTKYVSRDEQHPQEDVGSGKSTDITSIKGKRSDNETESKNEYFYSNDSLVKEVLAAKETLRKCLAKIEEKNKLRPMTAAEKKQGLGFDFKGFTKTLSKPDDAHHSNRDSPKSHEKLKHAWKNREAKTAHKCENPDEKHHKQTKRSSAGKKVKSKSTKDESFCFTLCSKESTCRLADVQESTTISLKASKEFERIARCEMLADVPPAVRSELLNEESHSHSKDRPSNGKMNVVSLPTLNSEDQKATNDDGAKAVKTKEDNMPLLVPEIGLNFDPSSDRDSSRSPPVITNQDEIDTPVGDSRDIESKMITSMDKIKENKKHSYNKDCEMTIADIITQLAYHEKATIKHRRYCNLCERWFPTTSRHRRHLAGYQHRYLELTQRKSIHALFILFTGNPCPRLLPANVVRSDCSIGELTPLQIAVQDVAKCAEHTEQNLKTKES